MLHVSFFSNYQDCISCEIGRYREEKSSNASAATACINCPSGWHQTSKGQTSCLPCTPGRFGQGVRQSLCKVCPRNFFTEDVLQTKCQSCKTGEYTINQGAASCITCGAGKFGESFGTGCTNCPAGWFRADGHYEKDTCVQCKLGETTTREGSASCSLCDFGKFGTKPGVCEECSIGRYQDSKGQADCMNCLLGEVKFGYVFL